MKDTLDQIKHMPFEKLTNMLDGVAHIFENVDIKKCLCCGNDFLTTDKRQLYCNTRCRIKNKNKPKIKVPTCPIPYQALTYQDVSENVRGMLRSDKSDYFTKVGLVGKDLDKYLQWVEKYNE